MPETNEHDPNLHDGYVGISRSELEAMAESELAQWQINHKDEPPLVILAEREWQRRMISHQLTEQFDLDGRLAKAAEAHAERIANSNRWWGIAAAIVGVIGTLGGVVLGKNLDSKDPSAAALYVQPQTASPVASQQPTPRTTVTSAGSSTTSQSGKKSP